jgi:hypothetical protein
VRKLDATDLQHCLWNDRGPQDQRRSRGRERKLDAVALRQMHGGGLTRALIVHVCFGVRAGGDRDGACSHRRVRDGEGICG